MTRRFRHSLPILLASLRAAGEGTRLRIRAVVAEGELSVSDLTDILGQSQPRISRHLKLMAEAGVPNGFTCTLLSTAQYGMHKSTAEVVQANLAEIGIQATLNLPDWAARVDLAGLQADTRYAYRVLVDGTPVELDEAPAFTTAPGARWQ